MNPIYIVLIVLVIAAIMYLYIPPPPRRDHLVELARITFACAMLVFLWQVISTRLIHL